jgi:hypothetical protein
MDLIIKVSWLSILMLFVLFIVFVFPSNAALFFSMIGIGGLMYWLVMSVLKDGDRIESKNDIIE